MNTFQKWLSVIHETGNSERPWTESEIIYFRKAIGNAGIQNAETRAQLYQAFHGFMPTNGYAITYEQSEKGRLYLLTKSLKKNGSWRRGNKLGSYELSILRDTKMTHTLVGLANQMNGAGNAIAYYFPVYRATDSHGNSFDYIGAIYEMVEVLKINKTKVS